MRTAGQNRCIISTLQGKRLSLPAPLVPLHVPEGQQLAVVDGEDESVFHRTQRVTETQSKGETWRVSVAVAVRSWAFLLSWVEVCDRLVPSYFFTRAQGWNAYSREYYQGFEARTYRLVKPTLKLMIPATTTSQISDHSGLCDQVARIVMK